MKNKLQRSDKTKEKGIRFLGMANWKGNYTGETNQRLSVICLIRKCPRKLLPTSIDSYLPPAQNNPYVKVAYFGVVYFDPL